GRSRARRARMRSLPGRGTGAVSIAAAVAVCGGAARAELTPIRAMTLEQALAYARAHQPALQSALARVNAAAADTRIARAQRLPSFGPTLQGFEGTTNNTTASYLGAPKVDLPRIGGTRVVSSGDWTPSTSTLAALGAGQEVFDFGRIAAQAAVADASLAAERQHADA